MLRCEILHITIFYHAVTVRMCVIPQGPAYDLKTSRISITWARTVIPSVFISPYLDLTTYLAQLPNELAYIDQIAPEARSEDSLYPTKTERR